MTIDFLTKIEYVRREEKEGRRTLKQDSQTPRVILDLGSGSVPWVVGSYVYQHKDCGRLDVRTALQIAVTTLSPGDRYICFDRDEGNTASAALEIAQLTRLRGKALEGVVEFETGDGTNLPYEAAFVDIVILSNVLSAPIEGRLYQGSIAPRTADDDVCVSSEEAKIALVNEAIRVLKPEGSLIIANDLTPIDAKDAMRHLDTLSEQGRVYLEEEHGAYEDTDDWIIWHRKYRLGPRPDGDGHAVHKVPLNDAQREAIEQWRDEWSSLPAFNLDGDY